MNPDPIKQDPHPDLFVRGMDPRIRTRNGIPPPTLSWVRNTAQGQPNMPSAIWLLKPSTGTSRKFDGSTENTSAATEINTYGTYTGGKLSEPSLANIAVPVGCRAWTNLSTLLHVGDDERGRALPLCAPLTRRVGGPVSKAGAAVVALRQMRSTKKKKTS